MRASKITLRRLGSRSWPLALAAAVALTTPASAQFGLAGGFQDAFRPGFTARDVQLAVTMLDLDDSQKLILETLYEDYQEDFRTGIDGFRQNMMNMRSDIPIDGAPDPGQILRVVFGAMNEWRYESKDLIDTFNENLKAILNDEQTEAWLAFDRRLYRLRYLANGRLAAEDLDLLLMVKQMNFPPPQLEALKPLLQEYEARLDNALRQREAYFNSSQDDLLLAIQNEGSGSANIGIRVAQRQVELRKAVRDINEEYANAVAEALPEELGDEFLTKVREKTYVRIFRKTQLQRLFDAAERINSLEPETLEAVKALHQLYVNELNAFNERLIEATRRYEPENLKNKAALAASQSAGRRPQSLPDPLVDEFAKRRELDVRYIEQLKALLTSEQFATLPGSGRYLTPEERQHLAATTAGRRKAKAGRQLIGSKDMGTGSPKGNTGTIKKRPAKPPGN
ncbi:MAG: hypothetical protein V3T81_05960 [Thermoanaerobaculia bacterium]